MKQLLSLSILCMLFFIPSSYGGIEFIQGSLDDAKAAAADQGKLIFIDAYTTWCGPCKRMSKNVFTDEAVGGFYNSSFINLKLDMEKGEGKNFQREYSVTAFPTLLFLDADGKVVHKVVGGMDAINFLKLGEFAAGKSNVSSEMQKAYEEGERDPVFMAKYIESLSKANRPLLKITNSYLDDQTDFSSEENLKILFYGSVEADSRIFNRMVQSSKEVESIVGRDAMNKQIVAAAEKTVEKAITYNNSDLLEEAIDKVKKYAPDEQRDFAEKARLSFYAKVQDIDNYLKSAKSYARQSTENKFELANYVLKNMSNHPEAMTAAEEWATDACGKDANEANCFTAAQILYMNGKYSDALSLAKNALTMAEKGHSGARPYIEKLINLLDEKLGSDKS